MGLFQTRWEAYVDHDRRRFTVIRNEWTKGITVQLDGTTVAAKAWSWVGVAALNGSVNIDGHTARLVVTIRPGSSCEILLDGERVPVNQVR